MQLQLQGQPPPRQRPRSSSGWPVETRAHGCRGFTRLRLDQARYEPFTGRGNPARYLYPRAYRQQVNAAQAQVHAEIE
jgi:hypothetical protein